MNELYEREIGVLKLLIIVVETGLVRVIVIVMLEWAMLDGF
jgi:hypothetical protein